MKKLIFSQFFKLSIMQQPRFQNATYIPLIKMFLLLIHKRPFLLSVTFLERDKGTTYGILISIFVVQHLIKKQRLSWDFILSQGVTKQGDSLGIQNCLGGNQSSMPTKQPLMLSRSLEKRNVYHYQMYWRSWEKLWLHPTERMLLKF